MSDRNEGSNMVYHSSKNPVVSFFLDELDCVPILLVAESEPVPQVSFCFVQDHNDIPTRLAFWKRRRLL